MLSNCKTCKPFPLSLMPLFVSLQLVIILFTVVGSSTIEAQLGLEEISSLDVCADAFIGADINKNNQIESNEFVLFYNGMASTRCAPHKEATDVDVHMAFDSLACVCLRREGFAEDCCMGNNSALQYYIPGTTDATIPTTTARDEDYIYMRLTCMSVDALIGPNQCNSTIQIQPQKSTPDDDQYQQPQQEQYLIQQQEYKYQQQIQQKQQQQDESQEKKQDHQGYQQHQEDQSEEQQRLPQDDSQAQQPLQQPQQLSEQKQNQPQHHEDQPQHQQEQQQNEYDSLEQQQEFRQQSQEQQQLDQQQRDQQTEGQQQQLQEQQQQYQQQQEQNDYIVERQRLQQQEEAAEDEAEGDESDNKNRLPGIFWTIGILCVILVAFLLCCRKKDKRQRGLDRSDEESRPPYNVEIPFGTASNKNARNGPTSVSSSDAYTTLTVPAGTGATHPGENGVYHHPEENGMYNHPEENDVYPRGHDESYSEMKVVPDGMHRQGNLPYSDGKMVPPDDESYSEGELVSDDESSTTSSKVPADPKMLTMDDSSNYDGEELFYPDSSDDETTESEQERRLKCQEQIHSLVKEYFPDQAPELEEQLSNFNGSKEMALVGVGVKAIEERTKRYHALANPSQKNIDNPVVNKNDNRVVNNKKPSKKVEKTIEEKVEKKVESPLVDALEIQRTGKRPKQSADECRGQLSSLVQKYFPEKLFEVEKTLDEFVGNEEQVVLAVEAMAIEERTKRYKKLIRGLEQNGLEQNVTKTEYGLGMK